MNADEHRLKRQLLSALIGVNSAAPLDFFSFSRPQLDEFLTFRAAPVDMSIETTPMDNLAESRIREAVASGEFSRAQQLWNAYMIQLQEELRQGSFPAAKLAQVRDLMEWSRAVALCARMHAHDRLNSLLVAAEYASHPASPARPFVQLNI